MMLVTLKTPIPTVEAESISLQLYVPFDLWVMIFLWVWAGDGLETQGGSKPVWVVLPVFSVPLC